jgi:hypothetical protein
VGEVIVLLRRAPRVPRYRAPIVYGSLQEILGALAWTLLALAVVALCWAPIILAGIWLCRRLHGPH